MPLPEYLGAIPARDRIIARMRWLEATSPQRAQPGSNADCGSRDSWDHLIDQGILREAAHGLYYLDETRLPPRSSRGSLVVLMVVLGIGLLSLLFRMTR